MRNGIQKIDIWGQFLQPQSEIIMILNSYISKMPLEDSVELEVVKEFIVPNFYIYLSIYKFLHDELGKSILETVINYVISVMYPHKASTIFSPQKITRTKS